jgi:cell division septation protein DedD
MKMQMLIRLTVAALLGVAAAVLVSCGSTGAGLIPSTNASPLQEDFEAVARAAAAGNGSCALTESALGKTEQDFLALPASIDRGLHRRLEEGISNLRTRALAMCIQLTAGATSTEGTQTSTTPTTTTSTSTETTPTTTTSTTTTPTTTTPTSTTAPPSESGGTEAGEGEEGAGKGKGKGKGAAEGEGAGGAGAGGASAGGGQ